MSYALNAKPGNRDDGESETFVAFHTTQDPITDPDVSMPIGQKSGGMGDAHAAAVRRLTPVECERLQGLPDGWTDLGGTSDSRRYSALGDAVTVTVAHWLGERLRSVL